AAPPAWDQPVPRRIRAALRSSCRSHARRSRNHVPGISHEDEKFPQDHQGGAMISRKVLTSVALAAGAIALLSVAPAQQNAPVELHTLHVQGNVYMIVGAGG